MIKDAPVMLITNKRDEILLLQRTSEHKLFPNEWCLPGGKRDLTFDSQESSNFIDRHPSYIQNKPFEYKESNEECIFRECEEELGCKIYAFKDTMIYLYDRYYAMKVYIALSKTLQITKEFPNREHVQYCWFHKRELPELLSVVTRELIENYDF